VHDPGKILLDVVLAVALGGDCLADVGMLRAEPAVFGPVASDPTVSRLIDVLASAGPKALAAIRTARAHVREHVWKLAGQAGPDAGGQVIVDIDGVLVLAHSEKQDATATWKKTFGHHPLMAFVDHGSGGSGEPVAGLLRPGNAGSNTAADHITTAQLALAQLPMKYRRGRQTLIRTDSGGGTHEFTAIHRPEQPKQPAEETDGPSRKIEDRPLLPALHHTQTGGAARLLREPLARNAATASGG
jgi:hypothetical protein